MGDLACRVCGTPFRGKRGALYCSGRCRWQAWALRHQKQADPRPAACAVCGQDFHPARSDAKYCSGNCRQTAYRRREVKRKRNWSRGRIGE